MNSLFVSTYCNIVISEILIFFVIYTSTKRRQNKFICLTSLIALTFIETPILVLLSIYDTIMLSNNKDCLSNFS